MEAQRPQPPTAAAHVLRAVAACLYQSTTSERSSTMRSFARGRPGSKESCTGAQREDYETRGTAR